jgi:hypothetical protein
MIDPDIPWAFKWFHLDADWEMWIYRVEGEEGFFRLISARDSIYQMTLNVYDADRGFLCRAIPVKDVDTLFEQYMMTRCLDRQGERQRLDRILIHADRKSRTTQRLN